jgi:ribose-phosphate pyrophosphokinase
LTLACQSIAKEGAMRGRIQVFGGNGNSELVQEICDYIGLQPGRVDIHRFSNENLFVQIQENVRESDVFVVQPFASPVHENLVELLLMLDALRSASASRITAVIPYYSYARSDKKDAPRISIAGRLIADLLVTAGANRVLTMNLHKPQVHGFFSVPTDHLFAAPVLLEYFNGQDLRNTVVVAPDAGHVKEAANYAERLQLPLAFVDKRRVSDLEVETNEVVGDVEGKRALVFDDEISAGSSLLATTAILRDRGVVSIRAAAVHGVLCASAVDRIEASSLEQVVVTNTVPVPPEKRRGKIVVLSVAPLFGEAIKRIHSGESVSSLFV